MGQKTEPENKYEIKIEGKCKKDCLPLGKVVPHKYM